MVEEKTAFSNISFLCLPQHNTRVYKVHICDSGGRVVSQAQFQIGAAPQKAVNRSKIGATSRGVPQKAENRSKIGATVRGGL